MLLSAQEHKKTGGGGHAQRLQATLHPPGKCCYPPIPCCPILSPCSRTGLQQFSLQALSCIIYFPSLLGQSQHHKDAIIFPLLQRESFLHHAFLFPASLFLFPCTAKLLERVTLLSPNLFLECLLNPSHCLLPPSLHQNCSCQSHQ